MFTIYNSLLSLFIAFELDIIRNDLLLSQHIVNLNVNLT